MIAILDLTSCDRSELPADTRTVDVPGDRVDRFDDETGSCTLLSGDDGDAARMAWTSLSGDRHRSSLAIAPLSSRGVGTKCMVESSDRDDAGRPLWWLSEVVE